MRAPQWYWLLDFDLIFFNGIMLHVFSFLMANNRKRRRYARSEFHAFKSIVKILISFFIIKYKTKIVHQQQYTQKKNFAGDRHVDRAHSTAKIGF